MSFNQALRFRDERGQVRYTAHLEDWEVEIYRLTRPNNLAIYAEYLSRTTHTIVESSRMMNRLINRPDLAEPGFSGRLTDFQYGWGEFTHLHPSTEEEDAEEEDEEENSGAASTAAVPNNNLMADSAEILRREPLSEDTQPTKRRRINPEQELQQASPNSTSDQENMEILAPEHQLLAFRLREVQEQVVNSFRSSSRTNGETGSPEAMQIESSPASTATLGQDDDVQELSSSQVAGDGDLQDIGREEYLRQTSASVATKPPPERDENRGLSRNGPLSDENGNFGWPANDNNSISHPKYRPFIGRIQIQWSPWARGVFSAVQDALLTTINGNADTDADPLEEPAQRDSLLDTELLPELETNREGENLEQVDGPHVLTPRVRGRSSRIVSDVSNFSPPDSAYLGHVPPLTLRPRIENSETGHRPPSPHLSVNRVEDIYRGYSGLAPFITPPRIEDATNGRRPTSPYPAVNQVEDIPGVISEPGSSSSTIRQSASSSPSPVEGIHAEISSFEDGSRFGEGSTAIDRLALYTRIARSMRGEEALLEVEHSDDGYLPVIHAVGDARRNAIFNQDSILLPSLPVHRSRSSPMPRRYRIQADENLQIRGSQSWTPDIYPSPSQGIELDHGVGEVIEGRWENGEFVESLSIAQIPLNVPTRHNDQIVQRVQIGENVWDVQNVQNVRTPGTQRSERQALRVSERIAETWNNRGSDGRVLIDRRTAVSPYPPPQIEEAEAEGGEERRGSWPRRLSQRIWRRLSRR